MCKQIAFVNDKQLLFLKCRDVFNVKIETFKKFQDLELIRIRIPIKIST